LRKWRRFPQLVSQPGIGGILGRTEVHQASRAQLDDHEHEQRSEEDVIALKEITAPDLIGVVSHKRRPGVPGLTRCAHIPDVILNSALADSQSEL
jgi:hypothetical protein